MDMWAAYAKLVREYAPQNADFVGPFPHRQASARSGRRVEGERDEAAEWRTENHLQEDPVAVAEESLESDQRSERAAIHAGALEYADCPCLLFKRIVSTVLGLPSAQTSRRTSPQVDEFGDALAAGAHQEICQNAPFPSGWNFALDQTTALEWRRGRDE